MPIQKYMQLALGAAVLISTSFSQANNNASSIKLRVQSDILAKQAAYSRPESGQRYVESIKRIMMDMNLEGAEKAAPVSDHLYNVTIRGFSRYRKDFVMANIPSKLWNVMYETTACDIDKNGGCLVIERNHEDKPYAFYVGFVWKSKYEIKHVYRQEVNMKKHVYDVNFLDGAESGMTVFSQAMTTEDVVRVDEDDLELERLRLEAEEARKAAEQQKAAAATLSDQRERALIRGAIRNGNAVDGDMARRQFQATQTELDTARAEQEMSEIYKAKGQDFAEMRRQSNSNIMTCYIGGKLDVKRSAVLIGQYDKEDKSFSIPFFGKEIRVGGDKLFSIRETKPMLAGDGKVLCYKDGKVVQQRRILMQYFVDFIGLGLTIPHGTYYVASVGIGYHDGIFDLITRKLPNGQRELFRDWIYIANAEASYGVGVGLHLVGLSSGREQKPILSLFSVRGGVDVLGIQAALLSRGRIGIHPDEF